ncbi:tetratricopeptide repeat protein [Candidatus Eisenbacteria bacterium]|uniref:Tetratricopeptide repeat protein n=1 Tax=Eiseniibacteriota bacterium TaxID=2212470 RepID=A0ABV6YIP7_UNCEI
MRPTRTEGIARREVSADAATAVPPCTPVSWAVVLKVCGPPALVAAAVFANTLWNGLTHEDRWTLQNVTAWAGDPWWTYLRTGRGFTYLVHTLDTRLWGDWTAGFHLTNVILHAVASAIAALATLTITRSRQVAIVCGLLFAVHPVHAETVASLAFRKDALAMIFAGLALILWLRIHRSLLRYGGTLICMAVALLSKEASAAGVIPMLFLADLLPRFRRHAGAKNLFRRAFVRAVPLLLLGVAATAMFAGDLQRYLTDESVQRVTRGTCTCYEEVVATSMASVPESFRLLFYPNVLSNNYPPRVETHIGSVRATQGIVLLVCWIVATVLLLRRRPVIAFAMGWVVVTYLPSSNLVPLTQFFVAEHYLYVPSFGVCLLLSASLEWMISGIGRAPQSRWAWPRVTAIGFVVVLLLAGSVRTVVRNRDWYDDVSLASSAIRAGFGSARTHTLLGIGLIERGDHGAALEPLTRAATAGYSLARVVLADLLRMQGDLEESALQCKQLLRSEPYTAQERRMHAGGHVTLGRIRMGQERWQEAATHYKEGLSLDANQAQGLGCLAWLMATCPDTSLRNGPEAIRLAERACRVTAGKSAEALFTLAIAYASVGRRDAALRAVGEAHELARSKHLIRLVERIEALRVRLEAE